MKDFIEVLSWQAHCILELEVRLWLETSNQERLRVIGLFDNLASGGSLLIRPQSQDRLDKWDVLGLLMDS